MGLYSTLVRRRTDKCLPGALQGFSITAQSSALSESIPLQHIDQSQSLDYQSSQKSVYSRFLKRAKKRDAVASSAKKKNVKDYLPDRDATIGGLTLIFTAVRDVGDATNIGYMKGLAGLVLLIIEVTEGVRTCKSEVQRLTKHIVELINALINELNSTKEKPSDETLYQIESLQGKLERIHTKLQKMREGSYWSRLVRQAEDNLEIVRFNEDIKHHLRVFGIQQHLSIHSNLARHDSAQEEHRSSLINIIDNGHKKHMRAIHKTMSNEIAGIDPISEKDEEMLAETSNVSQKLLADGKFTEEPESMSMDVDSEMDLDDLGTIKGDDDEQGYQHCLPPNPKLHVGHEDQIEHIADMLCKHQFQVGEPEDEEDQDNVSVFELPATHSLSRTPSVVLLPQVALSSTSFPLSTSSNPFATPPVSPRSFSMSLSAPVPQAPLPSFSLSSPPPNSLPFLPSPATPKPFPYFSPSSSQTLPYLSPHPTSSRTSSLSSLSAPNPFAFSSLLPYSTPTQNAVGGLTASRSAPSSPSWTRTSFGSRPTTPSRSTTPTPRQRRPRGPARLALLGDAGVGKSSIAKRAMHVPSVAEMFRDRRIWVECGEATTIEQIVAKIVKTMCGVECRVGEDATGTLMKLLSPSPVNSRPTSIDPQGSSTSSSSSSSSSMSSSSSILSDSTSPPQATSPPPTLLLLDNLDKAWSSHNNRQSVENLLTLLASLPQLALIITLRGNERPLGVMWTRPFLSDVGPLQTKDALAVFTAIADVEEEKAMPVVLACEGNPQLITQAATQAQFDTLPSLLARLEQRNRAREQSKNDQPRGFVADSNIVMTAPSNISGRL